jgi:hypothetical protein
MNDAPNYPQYCKNMRLTFATKDMIHDNGSINHKYFLVKKGIYWSSREDEALVRGIELFGTTLSHSLNPSSNGRMEKDQVLRAY